MHAECVWHTDYGCGNVADHFCTVCFAPCNQRQSTVSAFSLMMPALEMQMAAREDALAALTVGMKNWKAIGR